jgi:murein DD-endopeptidase MepM/ murein hydrolase activator NlpD
MGRTIRSCLLACVLALASTGTAHAAAAAAVGSSDVAALQVALRAKNVYRGVVDGFEGPKTRKAVAAFQRRSGLTPDGVAGPQTRAALGALGTPELGTRPLSLGATGWDVTELQFVLAWHGFPSGPLDGTFGPHTQAALARYQHWAGLPPIGIAGPATVVSLRGPPPSCPIPLAWPVRAQVGDTFGPRGNRFHSGVDLKAAPGTPVTAAAAGRVSYAGFALGGWGNLVVVESAQGLETFYAHLARVDAQIGEQIPQGGAVGLVGATGDAVGPHLHFEVRVRGAAVDPLPALPTRT